MKILKTYLKSYELVEIKTTGMGSLFRLSYKVELLTKDSEKQLIDEIRIKNSNLEGSRSYLTFKCIFFLQIKLKCLFETNGQLFFYE